MVNPAKLAGRYIGGITHAHTVLSNHPDHRESDLTIDRIVQTLRDAGLCGEDDSPLQFVMLNEHPSDPAKPHKLGRLSLRGRRLLRQRRRPIVGRLPIYYGLEVSLMANGTTDLTPRLADRCPLVIASRHGLPARAERDPVAILDQLRIACDNPSVDVIGHPPRYIEDLPEVDWAAIFASAKQTGTAIEINLNAFPKANSSKLQHNFWDNWIATLAHSSAWVFIGTDLHNQLQLETLIAEWHSLASSAGRRDNHLAQFLLALDVAGIDPARVVTASIEVMQPWLALDKPARTRAILK